MVRSIISTLVGLTVLGLTSWVVFRAKPDSHERRGHLRPRAVVDFNQKEMGVVQQGTVIITQFPIRNLGHRRLVVIRQTIPCCDDAANVTPIIIEPGNTELLQVQVDTARWSGRLSQTDWQATNDPELPEFELTVTATVQ